MRVLGIETSCDETGIAIYDSGTGLLAHALYSQVRLHEQYGGVVPELASRDHVLRTLPLVDAVLAQAGLAKQAINAVAYTAGPGLAGALLVGVAIGRGLGERALQHLGAQDRAQAGGRDDLCAVGLPGQDEAAIDRMSIQ